MFFCQSSKGSSAGTVAFQQGKGSNKSRPARGAKNGGQKALVDPAVQKGETYTNTKLGHNIFA